MSLKFKFSKYKNITDMEVELSPFMLFGGENGIGKTHLMKLLKSMEQFLIEDVKKYFVSSPASNIFSKFSTIDLKKLMEKN